MEDEFEELDRMEKDYRDNVRRKKSLSWYWRWRKERGLMNWKSNKRDRIVKRYSSGVMEFRIGCERRR